MSNTIWKFPFNIEDEFSIEIPDGAKILCIQTQNNAPCIWAQVNPNEKKGKRNFKTFGTGHSLPENPGQYIGTYQISGGSLVFHVYEQI